MPNAIETYCTCMEEIKNRSSFVEQALKGEISLGANHYDYEFLCLHFRKILELIAFSSIMGSLNDYKQTYQNAHKHWHADKILTDLEKINPNFYPMPITTNVNAETGIKNLIPIQSGYLSREEFSKLYDLCGSILHVPNTLNGQKSVNFVSHPAQWLNKIHLLLSLHCVQLNNSDELWIVVMNSPIDGKVHAYTAKDTPVEQPGA